MSKKLKRFYVITLAIICVAIVIAFYRGENSEKLAALIRDNDAVGVSKMIASNPKLVNANLDSRSKLKPLDLAASLGRETICSNLVASGADVNSKDVVGESPLYFALTCDNSNLLVMFLKQGADVSLANIDGNTALHWAVGVRDTNAVIILLQHGADPKRMNRFGQTPLDIAKALKEADPNLVKILAEATSKS